MEIGAIQDESQREGQIILSDMRGHVVHLTTLRNSLRGHADAIFGSEPNAISPEAETDIGKDIPFVSQRNGLNVKICELLGEIETQVNRSRFF